MGVRGQHHAPAALPPEKTRYPLYRRLGGPQGRSGRVRKIPPPPTGIRSPDRSGRSESLYRLSYRSQFHSWKHEEIIQGQSRRVRKVGKFLVLKICCADNTVCYVTLCQSVLFPKFLGAFSADLFCQVLRKLPIVMRVKLLDWITNS